MITVILMFFAAATSTFAHDEGHGPKLVDQAKEGGTISAVINGKEVSKGAKAALVYKSELVRTEDGTIQLYLYDKEMKSIDLSRFGKTARGVVEFKKKKKWVKNEFLLSKESGFFSGKAPIPSVKPFNIDVFLMDGSNELLTAFENLD